jgi:hypothetical protein
LSARTRAVFSSTGRARITAGRRAGAAPGASHGVDVDAAGTGWLADGRLYQLVRQHQEVRERTVEITFREAGAEAYVFTFG